MTEPAERWRRPIAIHAINEDEHTGVRYSKDENWYRGIRIVTDEDGYNRLRHGYVCIQCYEPHEQPMPETCSLCGFEMERLQRQVFVNEFLGEEHIGPSTSLADELERLDFEAEKMKWERDPTNGILVPRSSE